MDTTWVPEDTFGSRLARARKASGLSAEEAAARCEIKPSTWKAWEREAWLPHDMAGVAVTIERCLGVDRRYLLWGETPGEAVRLSRESDTAGQSRFSGSDIDAFLDANTPTLASSAA